MIIDKFIGHQNNSKIQIENNLEHPIRSFTKALSWRILGTADTMLISWFITGEITMAISIGSIEVVTKMILYYGHERFWNTIKWQKK